MLSPWAPPASLPSLTPRPPPATCPCSYFGWKIISNKMKNQPNINERFSIVQVHFSWCYCGHWL